VTKPDLPTLARAAQLALDGYYDAIMATPPDRRPRAIAPGRVEVSEAAWNAHAMARVEVAALIRAALEAGR
jgi:hypothetical protein